MFGNWIRSGLASGRVTTPYPKKQETLQQHDAWHTFVVTVASCEEKACSCIDLCPTDAITYIGAGMPMVDTGACIGCGRCVTLCPTQAFAWSHDVDRATLSRDELILKFGGVN